MVSSFQSRRRYPRIKVPARFRVKARLRFMGKTITHYFNVENLSMGGANLISHQGVPLEAAPGDTFEVLIFGGELSLRCVARYVQGTKVGQNCVQAGIEILGIDEKSRKILGDFLERLTKSSAPVEMQINSAG